MTSAASGHWPRATGSVVKTSSWTFACGGTIWRWSPPVQVSSVHTGQERRTWGERQRRLIHVWFEWFETNPAERRHLSIPVSWLEWPWVVSVSYYGWKRRRIQIHTGTGWTWADGDAVVWEHLAGNRWPFSSERRIHPLGRMCFIVFPQSWYESFGQLASLATTDRMTETWRTRRINLRRLCVDGVRHRFLSGLNVKVRQGFSRNLQTKNDEANNSSG